MSQTGRLSALKWKLSEVEVLEALEFWSQLGRVFMRDGQLFPKPQLVVDLIRPLVHHKPMNLLENEERLGLLNEESCPTRCSARRGSASASAFWRLETKST